LHQDLSILNYDKANSCSACHVIRNLSKPLNGLQIRHDAQITCTCLVAIGGIIE
jgi:hypothetical protein